tara:strand:+ start:438 stop:572 length:135 start_codon:yes stop_codon:yes gene_type:complete
MVCNAEVAHVAQAAPSIPKRGIKNKFKSKLKKPIKRMIREAKDS